MERKGRSSLISNCKIELTETDPLERLKEFCKQGKYHYQINWDHFVNGFMCECIVYYQMKRKSHKMLKKEVFWIETRDLMKAKKTIAAIMLESLGLGLENSEDFGKELIKIGTKTLTELVSEVESTSWADIAERG